MPFIDSLLQTLFVIFGVLVIVLVLLRRGEGGGGLGGALGGGMGSDSVFGVKAAKTLDKLIAWISGIFLFIGLLMYTPLIREGGLAGYNQAPKIGAVKIDKTAARTGESVKISVSDIADPEGHKVTLTFYLDDGDNRFIATFDEEKAKVEWKDIADGKASTTLRFSTPGIKTIWVRAEDNQSAGTGRSVAKSVSIRVTGDALPAGTLVAPPGSGSGSGSGS